MTKIAVIQTAFPGDVILASPVFEALKYRERDCLTTAIVRPESASILENNPFVDNILIFDKYGADKGISGLFKVASRLKGYDRAIVIQRYFRSALIPFLARIPQRIGFHNSAARPLFTSRIEYDRRKHEVKRCLDLIGENDPDNRFRPRIYIDRQISLKADELLNQKGITYNFAVIAPGSVWATKRYAHYPALIDLIYDKLDLPVVLVGGPDDNDLAAFVTRSVAHMPHDLCGQTSLMQSAAIISKARIVFCNDSAPAHMAAALGTPVVAIFGPTVPAFGFSPYSENSAVVDIGHLDCRPCSSHGTRKCPRGHFKCMNELSPEKVLETGRLLLAGAIQNRLR
ncbi:MAG: lipopolysaccharide heptosyltransferase II [candidate division Zixibacteria bacterium RBG_16_53_22]|nr:MAG: lipopolysaccharide heptosyltransferase II [candidate division Zixibacteria bacterium RBG_16_53_22]